MLTQQQILDELNIISVQAIVLHDKATRLMKEMGQVSDPLPLRGRRKQGPLSQEEVNKFLAKRLKSIKN